MIYESVEIDAPIRQGDIFRDVPRLEMSLAQVPVVDDDGQRVVPWEELIEEDATEDVTALVQLKPVNGIVVTQDCDAARGQDVSLAFIDTFEAASKKKPETANSWQKAIVRQMKDNLRYFYLPQGEQFGVPEPMAADFRTILRLPREELSNLRTLRTGRLNEVAYEHFRETIAQFFRRYPYNEWYPLTKEQAAEYEKKCSEDIELYPWQK